MTSEKQMRGNVLKVLRQGKLDARPVENAVDIGFPDIEYIGGLLELKAIERWPARPTTGVSVPHYTQEQRMWHRRRHLAGGRIHVLLQVGREFLLFDGLLASTWLGRDEITEAGLRTLSAAQFPSLADLQAHLVEALKT